MLHKCWKALIVLLLFPFWSDASESSVNIYTSRKGELIQPAFEAFTKKTGIRVEYLTGETQDLIERIQAEGEHTSADLLLTVDAGNLWKAQQQGIFQTVHSEKLNQNIPPHLREPNGYWFGLTLRARTIVYSSARVSPEELSTYQNLGDPKWKGRLCLRTARSIYNQSLVATMLANTNEGHVETTLSGWMGVVGRIFAKDTHLLSAIKSGQCDVGIVNSYYLARELIKNPETPIGLFWANQRENGVHVNISGGGVTRFAKRPEAAIRLLEFLSSPEAQALFANQNLEFPVHPQVQPNPLLSQWWGNQFKADAINLSLAGINQKQAMKLMKKVGYR